MLDGSENPSGKGSRADIHWIISSLSRACPFLTRPSNLRRLFFYVLGFVIFCFGVLSLLPRLLTLEATEYLGYVHQCPSTGETASSTSFVNFVRIQKTGSTFWGPLLEFALERYPELDTPFHKEWLCSSALAHEVADDYDDWTHRYSPWRLAQGCHFQGSNVALSNLKRFYGRHVDCGDDWRIVIDNGHISYLDMSTAVKQAIHPQVSQTIEPSQLQYPAQVTYVTLLREPRSRSCSEYHHSVLDPLKNHRSENNWLGISCCPDGLDNCPFNVWIDTCLEANNRQTRMISGVRTLEYLRENDAKSKAMVDAAFDHLLNTYTVFALLERFDESLLLLRDAFHLTEMNHIPNTFAPRQKFPVNSETGLPDYGYDQTQLEYASRTNELDLQLYALATSLFEERVDIVVKRDQCSYGVNTQIEVGGFDYNCA